MTAPRPWEWPLAVAVGLAAAALNMAWLAASPSLPGRDEASYLGGAELLAWMQVADLSLPYRAAQLYFFESFGHPPLIHWVSLLGEGRVSPGPPGPSLAALQLFHVLLATAGLALGTRLKDRAVGWLTVALLLSSPLALLASHQFGPDFPLLAWTVAGLALLATSDGLERPAPVLLAGVVLGLASLTKQPAALYLAPAALAMLLVHPGPIGPRLLAAAMAAVAAAAVIRVGGPSAWPEALAGMAALGALALRVRRRDPALAHLLGGAVLAGLVAGPWYLVHLRTHVQFFREFFLSDTFSRVVEHQPFTAAGAATVLGLLGALALPPLLILAVPVGLWAGRRTPPGRWLGITLGLLLLLVLALPTIHARYLVPLVAVLAPLAALGLEALPARMGRVLGLLCAVAFLFGPFLGLPARSADEVQPRVGMWLADGRLGSVLDARPSDLDQRLPSPFGWAAAPRPAWAAQAWSSLQPLAAGPPALVGCGDADLQRALDRLAQQWRLPVRVTREGEAAGLELVPTGPAGLTMADIALPRLDRYRQMPYPPPGPPWMLTLTGGAWVPAPPGSRAPWYVRTPEDPPPPPLVTPGDQTPVSTPRPALPPPPGSLPR